MPRKYSIPKAWIDATAPGTAPPRRETSRITRRRLRGGGTGLEIDTPYYQIDVKMEGVCTIVKSYLVGPSRPVKIGDRVQMTFRRMMTAKGVHNYFWKAKPV